MAAEIVAGALLPSALQTLFDKLGSRDLQSFFWGLKVNEGLLRKLKIMLWSANQMLNDAEQKQLPNPNGTLSSNKTIYEAEDMLDEINYLSLDYEQKRAKLRSRSISNKFQSFLTCFDSFDETIERKIKEIIDRLKFIVKQEDVQVYTCTKITRSFWRMNRASLEGMAIRRKLLSK